MKNRRLKMGVAILIGLLVLLLFGHQFILGAANMSGKEYNLFEYNIPESKNVLVVKEWSQFRNTGVDFYVREPSNAETFLGSISTNEYLPFSKDAFELTWEKDAIIITYQYSSGGVWKDATLRMNRPPVCQALQGAPQMAP